MPQVTECQFCGVAFNVGRRSCIEEGCTNTVSLKRYPAPNLNRAYSRFMSIKTRARRNNWEFNLTLNDVETIMNSPCCYCGSSLSLSEIDRKDSAAGYVQENVAAACRRCNTLKNKFISYDDMRRIVEILGWRDND